MVETLNDEVKIDPLYVKIFNSLKGIRKNFAPTAWLGLFIGLIMISCNGSMLKQLGNMGVPVLLRPDWRSQITIMIIFIPTIIELRKQDPIQRKEVFKRQNLLLFFGYSVMWTISLVVWLKSLDYTSIARSSLISNSYPVFLVVWYKIRKAPISREEIYGTLIAFAGVFVTMASNLGEFKKEELIGDLMCFGNAMVNAVNIIWSSKLRRTAGLFTFTFIGTSCMIIFTTILTMSIDGTTFLGDGPKALFGWTKQPFLMWVMALGIGVGVLGVLGYNYSLKFIPPLAYAVFKLLEAPLAGVVSVFFGYDSVPGVTTFIGGLIVIVGIVVVQVGIQKRLKAERAYAQVEASIEMEIVDNENKTVQVELQHENSGSEELEVLEIEIPTQEEPKLVSHVI